MDVEIARLRELYLHDLAGRAINQRPILEKLLLPAVFPSTPLVIEGRAAAAHNGVGVEWLEREPIDLCNHALVLLKFDTIAPIALCGQYLLLDPREENPRDKNLVVVETEEGQKLVRRLWFDQQGLCLEAANPTMPYAPVKVPAGRCCVRKIVGILYSGPNNVRPGKEGEEWVCPKQTPADLFRDVAAVRVKGTSLNPLAWDGQLVFVRRNVAATTCTKGSLACVDIEDVGAVIKRCYPMNENWILSPINPVDVEDPMQVSVSKIIHYYPVVGVLFKAP